MELDETEELCIDTEFDIFSVLYDALKNTISRNIEAEVKQNGGDDFLQIETMLKKILTFNMYRMTDEDCSVTKGPENTVYLCGGWLRRPLFFEGKMISTMEYLQLLLKDKKIVYYPDKDGAEFRKEIWQTHSSQNSSYNLPRHLRIDAFNKDVFLSPEVMQKARQNANRNMPQEMGAPNMGPPNMGMPNMGPPPGIQGGMPPSMFGAIQMHDTMSDNMHGTMPANIPAYAH